MGGLLGYVVPASLGETSFQTCSGRMGMELSASSMSALGFSETICTVLGSTAVTSVMPAVYWVYADMSLSTM